MAERDLMLAELTGGRILLDMLSAALTLPTVKRAKSRGGVKAAASVNVHHLVLNEHDVAGYRTFAKLSPPLRSEDDRVALVQAVKDGLIDCDRFPATIRAKRKISACRLRKRRSARWAWKRCWQARLRCTTRGDAPLNTLIRAMTAKPAELLNLPQGRLVKGARLM